MFVLLWTLQTQYLRHVYPVTFQLHIRAFQDVLNARLDTKPPII